MKTNKSNNIKLIIVAVALVAVCGICAAIFIISRYTPTKERMSGFAYFERDESEQGVLIILDNERQDLEGVYIDERLYVPYEFVSLKPNVRFYKDNESNSILYSDTEHIYSYGADSKAYSDENGNSVDIDYKAVTVVDGEWYLDWDWVANHTNCTYTEADEPSRLVIRTTEYEESVKEIIASRSTESEDEIEVLCAKLKKDTQVRYKGGIKSPIIEDVDKDTALVIVEDLGDWIKVLTPTGVMGYISDKDISDKVSYEWTDTWSETYSRIQVNAKVNLAWFQVGGTAGNAEIDSYLKSVSGLNVISPTWYSITDSQGNMSSFASKSFVTKMHNNGLQVWALVDDFNKDVDFKALFSSKSARSNMVSLLIDDAKKYGLDGINLDFENVKSEFSRDYLQFVRELSVECQKEGLVLSSDNYKPEAYNSCYNLKEQSCFVDYVIVMAYDEHYAGSDAGSVASLPFVTEAVYDTLELVPKEQVIVGIPFFTRIWTTANGKTTSRAVGMQAAINELNSDGEVAIWNDECGQYVVSYSSAGSTKQIWFEEEKSIEAKMQVISEAGVAGVAEWKLGLEKKTVWSVISQYLN